MCVRTVWFFNEIVHGRCVLFSFNYTIIVPKIKLKWFFINVVHPPDARWFLESLACWIRAERCLPVLCLPALSSCRHCWMYFQGSVTLFLILGIKVAAKMLSLCLENQDACYALNFARHCNEIWIDTSLFPALHVILPALTNSDSVPPLECSTFIKKVLPKTLHTLSRELNGSDFRKM